MEGEDHWNLPADLIESVHNAEKRPGVVDVPNEVDLVGGDSLALEIRMPSIDGVKSKIDS